MNPDDYSFFDIDKRDGIAFVTLRGIGEQNQYDHAGVQEMLRFPRELDADDDARVAVITGSGHAFSEGMAPTAAQDGSVGHDRLADYELGRSFLHAYVDCRKPIVIALNGVVVGMPATIMLVADVVVAESQVRFRDMHTPFGIVSATGALLWTLSVGLMKAKRYVLTGEWIDAAEAERLGLVSEVVDTGHALERATEYATKLAALRPESLQLTKRALNRVLRQGLLDVFDEAVALEFLAWPAQYGGGGAEDPD